LKFTVQTASYGRVFVGRIPSIHTVSRPAVLIAPATAIPALRQQTNLQESQAFADTDADRALEEVRRRPPGLIAIDRMFAFSLLGQAFLAQVRSDATLAACDVQMVGIRQSARYPINAPIFIDGVPGMLIDVSVTGAQVGSVTPLGPRHRLHLSLRVARLPLTAFVVRVLEDVPRQGLRYRAGVEFAASAAAAVAEYVSELPQA
jgi:hypothetical protein